MSTDDRNPLRRIDAAGVGVALLLTGAAYLFGVEPILAREAELRERQSEVRAARESAEAADRSLATLRNQVALAEQTVAENPLRLKPLGHLNTRLGAIALAATRHGLRVDQIEPGRPTPSTHYATVPIRVAGRSTYGGATRFLHELRTRMPDVAVANVDLAGDPRNRRSEAKFTISLMWHAAPDAASGEPR